MSSVAPPPPPPPAIPEGFNHSLHAVIDAGIDSVVLLGGTVRQTELRRAIGRHILQLPIDSSHTILDRWAEQVGAFARRLEIPTLRLRIILSPDEKFEKFAAQLANAPGASLSIETDPNPTRGTGGVLRDLVIDLPDHKWLVIANANQAFIGDPGAAVARLAAASPDMALMPAADGNGGFLLLTRCECLKGIAPRGFVDLKEQALRTIAQNFDVRVVDPQPDLTPTSIRSLRDYLDLTTTFARPGAHPEPELSPSFRIVEDGASVAPDARIRDSVILAGASVGPGALVARCVLGPGARVESNQVVRDQFIPTPGEEPQQ